MVWVAVEMAASLRHTVWAALAGLTLMSACAGPAGASSSRPAAAPPIRPSPSAAPVEAMASPAPAPVSAAPADELAELATRLRVLEARTRASTTHYPQLPVLGAINLIETSMGRIQGTSVAGALGPMQFMPATWASYGQGGNVDDPHDAILAAGRYLRAHGAPGDMARAVYAYNPSDLYVRAVTLYAGVMQADSRAFFGYYFWRVYVPTTKGDVLLPAGFSN